MKNIKIFLASSEELEKDRKEFEAFLSRKSKIWKDDRDLFLELLIWEDFIDAMSHTRLQDKYNQAIEGADIFVMLFWTKVGKYTLEEFEVARNQFLLGGRPLVYTYFKDTAEQVEQSLEDFRKKLQELEHFETPYANTASFLLHFSGQLDKLYRVRAPVSSVETAPDVSKQDLFEKINKSELFELFESLNQVFRHSNDSLNALESEFINPPNNFNNALFNTRLRFFVSKNIR